MGPGEKDGVAGAAEAQARFERFLSRYRSDLNSGLRVPLADYLREFAGIEERFATEWVAMQGARPDGASGSSAAEDLQRIGSYRLLRLLGRGGQGAVYLAHHLRLPKAVAVKVLLRGGAEMVEVVQRFEQEAQIGATLSHPAICTVLDAGIADAVPFIAMEYVEGETLGQRLARLREAVQQGEKARGKGGSAKGAGGGAEEMSSGDSRWNVDFESNSPVMPVEREPVSESSSIDFEEIRWTVRYFEQVARALHFAHEQGIIHRDLKPGNLMITRDGDPKIMDFGLARMEESGGTAITQTGDVLGTPAYMSPEQLSAKRILIDRRTDLWSLGVTLYESLCLSLPFAGPSREALYQAIHLKDPEPLQHKNRAIAKDLRVVVEKCLEKDRDRRYATALELADELARVLRKEPILARPVGPLLRTARWAERHPALAAVLALLFVSISSFSALQWATNRDLRQSEATAQSNAERAEAESAEKSLAIAAKAQALNEYARLADIRRLQNAREELAALWPIDPKIVQPLHAWQKRYEPLFANLPGHQQALADLRDKALRSEGGESGSYSFGEDLDLQFRHDNLAALVTDLSTFVEDEKASAVRNAALRLQRAEEIERLTITGPEVAAAWAACSARVEQSEKYQLNEEDFAELDQAGVLNGLYNPATRRLRLVPQMGLIPLGPDPTSGLEEFLHLPSHDYAWDGSKVQLPARLDRPPGDRRSDFDLSYDDGQRGAIGRDGVILVLVPGGSFFVGAQKSQSDAPNYDPEALPEEGPVQRALLRPWLISKYELTQGQWERGASFFGDFELRPSQYGLDAFATDRNVLPRAVGQDHPVETIDHTMAERWLGQMGLLLPTEVQWECAARGGSKTDRWSGAAALEALSRVANVSGEENAVAFPNWPRTSEHRDPFAVHGPVGQFEGNGYGLFDLSGNVWEWTRDGFTNPPERGRVGDGLRSLPTGPDANSTPRVYRGGSFYFPASIARVSYRYSNAPSVRNFNLGVRPSRALTP